MRLYRTASTTKPTLATISTMIAPLNASCRRQVFRHCIPLIGFSRTKAPTILAAAATAITIYRRMWINSLGQRRTHMRGGFYCYCRRCWWITREETFAFTEIRILATNPFSARAQIQPRMALVGVHGVRLLPDSTRFCRCRKWKEETCARLNLTKNAPLS